MTEVILPLTATGSRNKNPRIKSTNIAINLKFTDLTYEVEDITSSKILLNSISGEFRAGELSVIIGPSGSGKTTLLNILAGYRNPKTTGNIYVNDKPLEKKRFQRISRYVLQEDHINPYFTIWETLHIASHFKLDQRCTKKERLSAINEILDRFHLSEHRNTMMSKASGGQRKRVSVALELLDEPPIIVLDEPTTGLDEFSATQCVKQLKRLAQSGCTVVCSAHSPSARMLAMFDKVYVLAEGQCIYQGSTQHIVTYLEHFNLICPLNYNPADFIIDVASREFGNYHKELIHEIDNGKIFNWLPHRHGKEPLGHDVKSSSNVADKEMTLHVKFPESQHSWWSEFNWIFWRNIKQMRRDKRNIYLRILTHLVLSVLIGYAYMGIGKDGRKSMYNYHLMLLTTVLCAFVSMSPMFSQMPQEMLCMRREYFNKWYRLSSYFMALLASVVPITVSMSFISSMLIYGLSSQPMQLQRFLMVFFIIFLSTMMGSSYGLFIGTRFNLLNSLFLGSCLMGMWIIMAIYSVNRNQVSLSETMAMYSSCVRHSLEGLLAALLMNERPDIPCPPNELFCLFSKPDYILKITGTRNIEYTRSVVFLIAFYVMFSFLAYINLKVRLDSVEFLEKNRHYRYVKCLIKRYIKLF